MDNKLPRVLVPGIHVWQDKSSIRTLPEFFSCWDKDKIAHVYTKAGLPQSSVCDRFFRINENAVIKSVFNRRVKTSSRVVNTESMTEAQQQEMAKESKRYNGRHGIFLSFMRDMVWLLGKWKTKELDKFVEEFDPEVLFVTIYPVVYTARIQRYLIRKTGKPAVCFIADDNYSFKNCGLNPLAYIYRIWLRYNVRKLIKQCHRLFVITPKQKEEYDRIFGIDSLILTRTVDIDDADNNKRNPHNPLKMVYTGKLGIGRDKTVADVAAAVEEINKDGERIRFDVYSGDTPKGKLAELLSRGGNRFCGSVTADKIEGIQREADITLFAEAITGKYKNAARLSFSTKITDYFKSGTCIFAVGNKDTAPMDYLIKEDAAVAATSKAEIKEKLLRLCDNPSMVTEYRKKAMDCGKRNHNRKKMADTLTATLKEAAKRV